MRRAGCAAAHSVELHQNLLWATVPTMRTLHVGLRVSDLERSLAFYTAVGYTVVGTVEGTAFGSLTMLRLPGDDFVTIELVHDPAKGRVDLGTGINHLVIQVESLDATLADLATRGIIKADATSSARPDDWPDQDRSRCVALDRRHERMRWSEVPGPGRRAARGVRRQVGHPTPRPVEAPERRRSPGREEPGVGGPLAGQGLRPP